MVRMWRSDPERPPGTGTEADLYHCEHREADWTYGWYRWVTAQGAGVWLLWQLPFYFPGHLSSVSKTTPVCQMEILLQVYVSMDNIWTPIINKCMETHTWNQTKEGKSHSLQLCRVISFSLNSGVFITFPLLLTSSPPPLNHDFAPNSSSFLTIIN